MLRNSPFVETLKSEFKVPEKRFHAHAQNSTRFKHIVLVNRYWWMKIKALAETHNWLELEKFANRKKSPIGYEVIDIKIRLDEFKLFLCV